MTHHGSRWLKVGPERYAWSVGHAHEAGDGVQAERFKDCRELLRLRRDGAHGQLVVVFRTGDGDGHFVSEGVLMDASSGEQSVERRWNLNEPGVVRAVLDEAIAGGWQADTSVRSEVDGWLLLDAVTARRARATGLA